MIPFGIGYAVLLLAVMIGGVVGFVRGKTPAPAVRVVYCSNHADAGSTRCKSSPAQGGATFAHDARFSEGGDDD